MTVSLTIGGQRADRYTLRYSGGDTADSAHGTGRSGDAVSAFSKTELAYLAERRLARMATVGQNGIPHVVPVGWNYNSDHDTIDVGGSNLMQTKKYRDVVRTRYAAIVIDDLASVNPWRPRALEVRGRAEAIDGPDALIRIYPDRIVSWGL